MNDGFVAIVFSLSTFGIDQLHNAVLAMGEIERLTEIFTIGLTIGVGDVDQLRAENERKQVAWRTCSWSSTRRPTHLCRWRMVRNARPLRHERVKSSM
jgi:hypothetical protein